jgi:N-acetylmuramic acid 6-phosphate (MurNAc-6-P) etherase
MINVKPTNEKLWERATRIIMQIADIDHDRAGELLKKHGSIRAALGELGLL